MLGADVGTWERERPELRGTAWVKSGELRLSRADSPKEIREKTSKS